jgi:hypothetical protein
MGVLFIAVLMSCHCSSGAAYPRHCSASAACSCVPGTLTFDSARTPSGSFVEECEPVMDMSAAAACSSFWGKR